MVGWERRDENKRMKSCPHPENGDISFSSLDWLKICIASTEDVGGLFPQSSSICDYVIMEGQGISVWFFFFILNRGNAVKSCIFLKP